MKKYNNSPGGKVLTFIRELANHNNREWFAQHKDDYEGAKALFEQMVQDAILRISTFDKSVEMLQPKDCTYRIYRDIRFSEDKSPYKRHMGAYICARGKQSLHGGYYIHLQPEECLLAGGCYYFPPKLLQLVRHTIIDNIDEYRAIVDSPDFKKYYPIIGEERLIGAPKGFKKDNPYLKYIQPKQYDTMYAVPDEFFCSPNWLDNLEKVFRPLKKFLDFINDPVDDYLDNYNE